MTLASTIGSSMGSLQTSSESPSSRSSEDSSNSNSSTIATNAVGHKQAQQQTPPSPAAPTRSRVTFTKTVTIRRTISACDYTPQERRACWYNDAEMRVMKQERRATIKLMESVAVGKGSHNTNYYCAVDDDKDFCYRGLEHKTKNGSRMRQFNQVDAAMAVMDEQELQAAHGINDPETLSRVYISCTLACQAAALEKGLRDQMVVLDQRVHVTNMTHKQHPHHQQQQPIPHMRQPRRLSNAAA
eukprot:CAMPEP_0198112068 /NCGR_PEP_ID=MMETSP1442-20131203/3970_1 /TAXON_ID= /ORGANISM="Craspedostauros australis, Strain CCMP3328" /LENGTH=242 /DNA_ID=CAMNT_0043768721 /DNA_START=289 /DNA_END=1017 /DNA_ORIENTATION=+